MPAIYSSMFLGEKCTKKGRKKKEKNYGGQVWVAHACNPSIKEAKADTSLSLRLGFTKLDPECPGLQRKTMSQKTKNRIA